MKNRILLLALGLLVSFPAYSQNVKISDLPAATELSPSDVTVVVQGGVTKKAPVTTSVVFVDTATSFAGTIPEVAKLGYDRVEMTPASSSTNISTNRMRITEVDLTSAAMTGFSHGIAGYDYLLITGNNNSSQHFGHEVKFQLSGTGTHGLIAMYHPAIDEIDGTVSNFVAYNNDIDLSGISGAVTNAYFLRNTNSDFKSVTAGIIEGATGNEVATAFIPPIVTGRYYFPQRWGSSSTAAPSNDVAIATPPIMIPNRTVFNRIGIEVTGGVASSVIRLGVYKMGTDGLPGELFYDAGTVSAATTGVKEITGNFTLEAGAYFLVYQATGGASPPTVRTIAYTDYDIIQMYGNGSANPAGATAEDWIYIANTGALPDPFGAITRLRVGAIPAVFIRKV